MTAPLLNKHVFYIQKGETVLIKSWINKHVHPQCAKSVNAALSNHEILTGKGKDPALRQQTCSSLLVY